MSSIRSSSPPNTLAVAAKVLLQTVRMYILCRHFTLLDAHATHNCTYIPVLYYTCIILHLYYITPVHYIERVIILPQPLLVAQSAMLNEYLLELSKPIWKDTDRAQLGCNRYHLQFTVSTVRRWFLCPHHVWRIPREDGHLARGQVDTI